MGSYEDHLGKRGLKAHGLVEEVEQQEHWEVQVGHWRGLEENVEELFGD